MIDIERQPTKCKRKGHKYVQQKRLSILKTQTDIHTQTDTHTQYMNMSKYKKYTTKIER